MQHGNRSFSREGKLVQVLAFKNLTHPRYFTGPKRPLLLLETPYLVSSEATCARDLDDLNWFYVPLLGLW